MNTAWCKLAGIDCERSLGTGWVRAIHPDDRERVVEAWHKSLRSGLPFECEYRFQRPDGVAKWVLGRATPFYDDDTTIGYIGSVTNIDDRRKAEELAKEREDRFRDVANQAPVMIGVTDAEGHITFLNKTWLDFRGKTLEEEEGWAWSAGLHPDDRERTCSEIEECISQNRPYSIEYRIQDRHGRYHWVYDTAIPRVDSFGERLGYIGTAIIIDKQKQLEDRLRRELSEKEMLLQEVHHRVKNNLQTISSLIGFQSRETRSPEDRRGLEELGQRLTGMALIHDLLYQSKRFAAINFSDYVSTLVEALQTSVVEGNRVRFEVDAEPVHLALREALPTGMILCELITNVCKYAFRGETGTCRILLRKRGSSVLVEVHDRGAGFPAGFDARVDGKLGWDLIRGLVGQLGGGFAISNDNGARVKFWFDAVAVEQLPNNIPDVPSDHEAMAKRKPKVFLVEDEAVVALQIKSWLRDLGYTVCGHVTHGEAAIRQIPSLNPDLILMDIRLADDISGLKVAEHVRRHTDIPIIFLTAYTESDIRSRAAQIAQSNFLAKPFDIKQLLEALSRY